MIKIAVLKEQLEDFFNQHDINYYYVNKDYKKVSVPIYVLGYKINNSKKSIPIMITIFKSASVIYFDCFKMYKINNKRDSILESVNTLNQYPFLGKFILEEDNAISYRCIINYSNLNKLNSGLIESILDSVPSAYSMCINVIENRINHE